MDPTTENVSSNLPTTYSSQNLISPSEVQQSSANSMMRKGFFTVGLLCFINLINYMDRFTIAGVLTDIQEDFHIDNSKTGLLQTAFILSYMIFAPIFGYLGDRYSRKLIMGCGIALWCLTTFIGSYMPNFELFILFRCLVGIGEASYSTIAPTIISDLFVKNMRTKFLALFYFAIPVGSGLGYIIGAETATLLNSWRWALRVTPFMGVIAIVLIFFSHEPERGQSEGTQNLQVTSYTADLKALSRNPSFILSSAGFTCVAFVAGALAWWGPLYMYLGIKTHTVNMTQNEISYKFGLVAMFAGVIGVPLGSLMAFKLRSKYSNCDPLICAAGLLFSSPMIYLVIINASNSLNWNICVLFLAEVSLNMTWPLVADMLLYVVIPTRRSTAEAFQILVSHALGDAGSPYFIGVISDAIQQNYQLRSLSLTNNSTSAVLQENTDEENFKALQYSLLITCFVEVLGAIFFFITAAYVLQDKQKAEKVARDAQLTSDVSTN